MVSRHFRIIGAVMAIAVLVGAQVLPSGDDSRFSSTLVPIAQAASVDYYLKIDGIEGESTDDAHKGEIEVLSWSWGETNAGRNPAGGGGGRVSVQDFTITKQMDKSSPKLMEAVAHGMRVPQVVLTSLRTTGSGRQEYLVITMKDVLVSSYQTGGSAGDVPTETLSLNFEEIKMTYTPLSRADQATEPVTGMVGGGKKR